MNISLLNTTITIQKQSVVTDNIGNHKNAWTDYYSCHATISGEGGGINGTEDTAAGTVNDHSKADFTVRYCASVADINTTEYRVCYCGEIYDIIGIDHQNNKHRSIKLKCRKVVR